MADERPPVGNLTGAMRDGCNVSGTFRVKTGVIVRTGDGTHRD